MPIALDYAGAVASLRTGPPTSPTEAASAGSAWSPTPPTRYTKVSVTVPTDTLTRIREEVGSRGVSAYLSRAADHELHRDSLRHWLDDMTAAHGPVPDEVADEVDRVWRDAAR